jgi:outer membrane protein OmpA-like peptidoglycan-associated protein
MPVARLISISPAPVLAAFILAALIATAATGVRAQNDTVIVGDSGGGGVYVDLSVLDELGRAQDDSDGLRFPGATVGPEETVRLYPPGTKPALKRPARKKPRRAKKRPAPKPKPPAAVAKAPEPAPKAPPMAEAPPPAPPAPPEPKPVAKAPPPPPAPMEPKDEAKAPPRSVTPPPPPAALSRDDVPPPPAARPDLPPVTPAPRTAVDQAKMAPPPPPEQTAALPKPPAGGTAFKVGATHAIAFGAGSASLPNDAATTLKAAAELLKSNAALRVQIKAYAAGEKDNESKARRLSLSRALGVRSVLIKEGVQPTRIDVRALGSQVPDGAPDRVDLSVVSR